MEKIKKDEIITAAKQYMQRHGMSQNALAKTCGSARRIFPTC